MKKADIVKASGTYNDPRFTAWLSFVLDWEIVTDKSGNIKVENVPGDNGGKTFAGIDIASHPKFPYSNPTPLAVAEVYFNDYWKKVRATELEWPVGEVTANFAVNMGVSAGVKLLQTAINVIPEGGACRVDGKIGPQTIAQSRLEKAVVLADMIEDEAVDRYFRIVKANPSQRKFINGWVSRSKALEKWWMNLKQV